MLRAMEVDYCSEILRHGHIARISLNSGKALALRNFHPPPCGFKLPTLRKLFMVKVQL